MQAANRVLKLYDAAAVFNALDALPRAFSLTAPFVLDEIRRQQAKLDAAAVRAAAAGEVAAPDVTQAPRRPTRRGGLRSKLEGA